MKNRVEFKRLLADALGVNEVHDGMSCAAAALMLHELVVESLEDFDASPERLAKALQFALDNWEPSDSVFDAAVKVLLKSAIQEYRDSEGA